jgi:hypothetical protein
MQLYCDLDLDNRANIRRLTDESVALELISLGYDSVFQPAPFVETRNHGLFIARCVSIEEKSGRRVDCLGSGFYEEFVG